MLIGKEWREINTEFGIIWISIQCSRNSVQDKEQIQILEANFVFPLYVIKLISD